MLTAANTKYNPQLAASVSSRGRGRGRGKAALAVHGSRKYDATGTTVINFEEFSTPLEETKIARNKKETSVKGSKTKSSKGGADSSSKQRSGSKKAGSPKSVSKDVYCICRGPYDGAEFMIACDRCEEWFHGRCIGMKPQEAKKSSHYYCDTCQRIRKMLGVDTTDEHVNPAKAKGQRKNYTERPFEKQKHPTETTSTNEKLQPLKIRTMFSSKGSSAWESAISSLHADHLTIKPAVDTTPYPQSAQKSYQTHESQSLSTSDHSHSPEVSRQTPDVVQSFYSIEYDTPSVSLVCHLELTSGTPPLGQTSAAIRNAAIRNAAAVEDEDEDVCPVCDFQCICNNNNAVIMDRSPIPVTPAQASRSLTAIKVPFQPNTGLQTTPDPSQPESMSTEHNSSYLHAEKRPVVPIHVADTDHDESFHTSLKNPMSTPSDQRQSNVIGRSGKGGGKTPFLIQGVKSKYTYRGHNMGKNNGEATKHLQFQSETSSGSDISDGLGDENQDWARNANLHPSDNESIVRPHARYASDSGDTDDADDALSLGSFGSLSDLDENSFRLPPTVQSSADTSLHAVSGDKRSSSKVRSGSREILPSVPMVLTSSEPDAEHILVANEDFANTKKRVPRKHKKNKPPLILSRKDEITLYTPAAATRRLATSHTQKAEPSKMARVLIKPRARTEMTCITYDPKVAEDVAALNATERNSDDDDHAVGSVDASPKAYGEDDIFGDGDLSDELSGDLSDIQSEDFDDLSDNSLDFSSSGDDDEISSGSNSPKEFNYSDMEEQDESLVDSDSSINSIPTDSSDSSASGTDSDIEAYPQDQDTSDADDEEHVFEREDSSELIDEEELLLLEEQERLLLAKAHGLHDVFSDEDSDPDRNPFESSEGEDDAAEDEQAFDGDDDYYSDSYYNEDCYDDDFDDMDEHQILAQLRGMQSDIQALLMIPPEQQEQLLLLQHYEDAHSLQQLQQVQQIRQQDPQNQAQNSVSDGADPQKHGTQQSSQMIGLLLGSELLPKFDVNVPDLDVVSEQPAASLANSLAKSMSANQGLDGPLFSELTEGEVGVLNDAESEIPINLTNTPLNASNKAASSICPETSAVVWNVPLLSMSSLSDFDLAFTPTPANTPIFPATIVGVCPSFASFEAVNQNLLQSADHLPDSGSLQHVIPPLTDVKGRNLKTLSSQGRVQLLPNSPSYKPFSSIMVPKLGSCESFSDQTPLAKAPAEETQLFILSRSRLQSSDSSSFKEVAQKTLSGLCYNDAKYAVSEASSSGAILEDWQVSGDMVDETSVVVELKRKNGDLKAKEVIVNHGKRRRLSTSSFMGSIKPSSAPESQSSLSAMVTTTPESESTLTSGSVSSPLTSSLSVTSLTKPLFTLGITASSMKDPSSFLVTSESGMTPVLYDFPKAATVPFTDPISQIISSSSAQKHVAAAQNNVCVHGYGRKGKELKQIDFMPMDDLLDTSALYGRSSSRSPSPERAGAGEDGSEAEISQTILKDLNRWERVPIGTFRKSRRPSSPYVGIQGALKPGNTTMSATLLADQQQQQLYQVSHRSVRKHHASSSSNILSSLSSRDSSLSNDSEISRAMQGHLLRTKHQSRLRTSTNSTVSPTAAEVQISMATGLASFVARDLLRRRRRPSSSSANSNRAGARAGGPYKSSKFAASGLAADVHAGLGIDFDGLTDSSMGSSKNGFSSRNADRVAGLSGPKDLMTDSTQLPSSACPTPLHSPLFSATVASGRVHHHSSGEPMVTTDARGKIDLDDGSPGEEAIVSHLELDIGKEMDGFHERLLARSKTFPKREGR
ncbi:hypothetical protein BGZ65_001484 [Modicella reniformis]|uniref:PHD-type domain-containing protein n=1 Tax=Modicella reniformis TaxID=1440133 RepID=A0A9P6MA29_9FUNG|nr:hypothetical protein BGZ65_001484 [Modicella reniformis]